MSEFSASYHLIASKRENAVELLERAGLHGFVFPEKNGAVTFVVKQGLMGEFVRCEQLIGQNVGTLVHFLNDQDSGWSYELFDGRECIARYSSSVNEEELMADFDPDHPEFFVPREDVSVYVYDGFFQMERVKEALRDSVDGAGKISVVQRSKAVLDARKGLDSGVTLHLKSEALTADEFVRGFGIFFYEWVAYHYLQESLGEDCVFDYGRLGKYPLIYV